MSPNTTGGAAHNRSSVGGNVGAAPDSEMICPVGLRTISSPRNAPPARSARNTTRSAMNGSMVGTGFAGGGGASGAGGWTGLGAAGGGAGGSRSRLISDAGSALAWTGASFGRTAFTREVSFELAAVGSLKLNSRFAAASGFATRLSLPSADVTGTGVAGFGLGGGAEGFAAGAFGTLTGAAFGGATGITAGLGGGGSGAGSGVGSGGVMRWPHCFHTSGKRASASGRCWHRSQFGQLNRITAGSVV